MSQLEIDITVMLVVLLCAVWHMFVQTDVIIIELCYVCGKKLYFLYWHCTNSTCAVCQAMIVVQCLRSLSQEPTSSRLTPSDQWELLDCQQHWQMLVILLTGLALNRCELCSGLLCCTHHRFCHYCSLTWYFMWNDVFWVHHFMLKIILCLIVTTEDTCHCSE